MRRVGLKLPLIVARRARDRIKNPPPPPAKAAVVALGLPDEDLIPQLRAVAEREGVAPGRVLAITDSLDFGALRRAGFAFEYVPSSKRAKLIAGEPYEAFAKRRVEAALAGRRAVRRIDLSAGS